MCVCVRLCVRMCALGATVPKKLQVSICESTSVCMRECSCVSACTYRVCVCF